MTGFTFTRPGVAVHTCMLPQGIEPRQPKQVVYSHPGTPVPHRERLTQDTTFPGATQSSCEATMATRSWCGP